NPSGLVNGGKEQFKVPISADFSPDFERQQYSVQAFNKDGVKGATDSLDQTPSGVVHTGRVFVVSIGINDYADSNWDLNYAASDAHSLATDLEQFAVRSTGATPPVAVELVSAKVSTLVPTKQNVRTAIDILSGKLSPISPNVPPALAQLDKLRPEDTLILSW